MQTKAFLWLDRTAYPFTSHYLNLGDTALHYLDEGTGDPVVLVHGTPSWSFDFRKVISALSTGCRCIAPDHIGFGLSDKPEQYDYSIQQHCRNLGQLIGQLGLQNITLVVHDFGGPIGFHYAISHPENVRQIVVLNSWCWNFSGDAAFKAFRKIGRSPLLLFLYKYLNFSPRVLLPESFGDRKLSRSLLPNYTKPFATPSQRLGCLAFAHSLLNDQDWFETLWMKRGVLQHKRMLFIWGMKDRFIPPGFLAKFSGGFMQATVRTLATCGHFPQEEEPETVIREITNFLNAEGPDPRRQLIN